MVLWKKKRTHKKRKFMMSSTRTTTLYDRLKLRDSSTCFATQGHRVSFSIIEPRVGDNIVLWVEAAIKDIHNYITERVPGRAIIGISICNDLFHVARVGFHSGLSRTLIMLIYGI